MHNTSPIQAPATPPCALTIAGSDSCGGAGIQADLKTFTALGVESGSVLTAITAQNTVGVDAVEVMNPDMVRLQLEAVLADLPIGAIKTGMLANARIIEVLIERLGQASTPPLIIDPVMVATAGARLLDSEAEELLSTGLLPLAELVTPNLPEAAALTGLPESSKPNRLAERMLSQGCKAVLIKGGHGKADQVEDVLVTASGEVKRFTHRRQNQRIHGTGCALSAAITAGIARGEPLEQAVASAIEWLQRMIGNTWQPLKGELAMLPFGRGGRGQP